MTGSARKFQTADLNALPRAQRRRTLRAMQTAAESDRQWFAENPDRRTYVRWALPDEPVGVEPGERWLAVVRQQGANFYNKYLFVAPPMALPDLSSEFAADMMFRLIAWQAEQLMLSEARAAAPAAGNA